MLARIRKCIHIDLVKSGSRKPPVGNACKCQSAKLTICPIFQHLIHSRWCVFMSPTATGSCTQRKLCQFMSFLLLPFSIKWSKIHPANHNRFNIFDVESTNVQIQIQTNSNKLYCHIRKTQYNFNKRQSTYNRLKYKYFPTSSYIYIWCKKQNVLITIDIKISYLEDRL